MTIRKPAPEPLQNLQRDYRAAFLRYIPRGDEAALHAGYEIGRAALSNGLSILDLVQVHHHILLEVLTDAGDQDLRHFAMAGSEFLLEILAAYDMAHRGLLPHA
jgi:hypothetical protein